MSWDSDGSCCIIFIVASNISAINIMQLKNRAGPHYAVAELLPVDIINFDSDKHLLDNYLALPVLQTVTRFSFTSHKMIKIWEDSNIYILKQRHVGPKNPTIYIIQETLFIKKYTGHMLWIFWDRIICSQLSYNNLSVFCLNMMINHCSFPHNFQTAS